MSRKLCKVAESNIIEVDRQRFVVYADVSGRPWCR